jgi:hypothetical protein
LPTTHRWSFDFNQYSVLPNLIFKFLWWNNALFTGLTTCSKIRNAGWRQFRILCLNCHGLTMNVI